MSKISVMLVGFYCVLKPGPNLSIRVQIERKETGMSHVFGDSLFRKVQYSLTTSNLKMFKLVISLSYKLNTLKN